jgi:hypothetical protein
MEKHIVASENAERIWNWLQTRGGLAVWMSINFSNFGASWTTPVNDANGTPTGKPTWQADSKPFRIITDPDEVVVAVDEEVKRFHVATRVGSQGFTMKCTDGATRRIRHEVMKAGEQAYYRFDYETQEAVILKPKSITPIAEYIAGLQKEV